MISSLRRGLRTIGRTLQTKLQPAAFLLTVAVAASVVAVHPGKPLVAQPAPAKPASHWFQIGTASWYGKAFNGKRTATGELFNMHSFTCAHRTLPLGSWLRITNLRNSRSTFVRVNDRGPYRPHAIVDLSFAAAQKLGMLGNGQVRVEQVRSDDPELAHALMAELSSPPEMLPAGQ